MKTLTTLSLFFLIVITVNGQCTADYSYSGENIDTVAFTNLSIASNAHYFWNFGDGSGSNEVNPIHIYPDDGHYLVSLYVLDTISRCSNAKDSWVDVIKPDTILC